jgi:hypothetical protein
MARIAGCCRAISNVALDQRRWFALPGRSISYADQAAQIAALKVELPWFAEAPYHCLQQRKLAASRFDMVARELRFLQLNVEFMAHAAGEERHLCVPLRMETGGLDASCHALHGLQEVGVRSS